MNLDEAKKVLNDHGYKINEDKNIDTTNIEDYYNKPSEECERLGDLAEILGYEVTYDEEGICYIGVPDSNEDVRKTKYFPIIAELFRLQKDVLTVEHAFDDDPDYKGCFIFY